MRNASFYKSKRLPIEDAVKQEQYHLAYEELIHDMFCNPDWVSKYGKQKKLRVLTYCMYYQGITARQLLLTNITPEAELDSERVFLGRLASKGMLQASSFRLPGNEPAVIYLLTPQGALHCRDKLLHLIHAQNLPVSADTVKAVYARFVKLTPVNSVGHFLSVRDIHAYFLSQFSSIPFHYGIECGVYVDGDVVSIADSLTGALAGSRRGQISFVSDAVLTYPSSGGVVSTTDEHSGLDVVKEDGTRTAAHLCRYHFTEHPLDENNCYVYVEQDMSTQHLNVLSAKVGNYTRTVAMQKRHPARHTLLFSLQTRASDVRDEPKATRPKSTTSSVHPPVAVPRVNSGGIGVGSIPAVDSDSFANTTAAYHANISSGAPVDAHDGQNEPSSTLSEHLCGSPDMSRYFRQECLSSVPAVAYAYYGHEWENTPIEVLAGIYESFQGNIGYMERRYSNAAKTLRLASNDMPQATIGELFSAIAQYSTSLEESKEKVREDKHHSLYLARKATFKKAVYGTEEIQEMFLAGFSVATTHNRAHESIVPFILPRISLDMGLHLKSLCNLYLGTDFNETPDYRDYVDSPSGMLTLRNSYTWSNGTTVYLENISDDFGGKERLLHYLRDGQWDGPQGYLICLVADDDISYLKEISHTTVYETLTGKQQLLAPLKVTYITYTQFTQARGLCMYHLARSDDADDLASIFHYSERKMGLVPLLPYGYLNNDTDSSR